MWGDDEREERRAAGAWIKSKAIRCGHTYYNLLQRFPFGMNYVKWQSERITIK